ncbi:lytic transglycosylase domain-containing protein [Pantoea sp. B9002]|uniref:transglycosylase SLT domain-containing protein n=1 Tax=Pantoea sp. B9002 TaxID=2726979 RepID=UPI0015A3F7C8|nr:transglycosylase SLT domain-containing protein [Pantoea sp. B9002]NWA64070.1 lytic transglycosylase domain-containing protein [Pantoea sp. B9002]
MINRKAGCLLITFFLCSGNALADDSDILLSMVSAPPVKSQMQEVWGESSSLSSFKGFSRKPQGETNPPREHIAQAFERPAGTIKSLAATTNQKFADLIDKYSEKYNVASSIVRELINQESRFNPKATSHKGAQGLMQLMPATASDCGITDAYNAEQNIDCGIKYFARKLDKYNSVALALAAYNAGDGAVDKYQGIPPYKETQNYVETILGKLGYRG